MPYYPSQPEKQPTDRPPGKRNVLRRVILCVSVLLIAYGSRIWDEFELEPAEDMLRFAILYGTMAVDLTCIALAIRLNLLRDAGKLM